MSEDDMSESTFRKLVNHQARRMDGVVYTRGNTTLSIAATLHDDPKAPRYVIGPDGLEYDWPLSLTTLSTWSLIINGLHEKAGEAGEVNLARRIVRDAAREAFRPHEATDNHLGKLIIDAIEQPDYPAHAPEHGARETQLEFLIRHIDEGPRLGAYRLSQSVLLTVLQALKAAKPAPEPEASSDDAPIKAGDVVKMRSNSGPLMTVDKVNTDAISVVWFTTDNHLKGEDIPPRLLVKVPQ